MLSSISTPEDSGPTWLDRLRSSKGIPADNYSDLEQFLNQNPNSNSQFLPNSSKTHPNSASDSIPVNGKPIRNQKTSLANSKSPKCSEKNDIFVKINSALSELFVMGNPSDFNRIREKSSRKQKNPKIYAVPGVEKAPSLAADNSVVAEAKEKEDPIEEDKSQMSFAGYSREDVMIIDTSAPVWKSEKLIYRKGNVWKVREKKSKFKRLYGGRKKRKASFLDRESEGKKKKKKKNKKKMKTQKLSLSPGMRRKVDESGSQSVNRKASKESEQNVTQVPKKSHVSFEASKESEQNVTQVRKKSRLSLRPISRSPRKPAKRNLSLFLAESSLKKDKGPVLPEMLS